ncbi:radical SAM protein, partial [Candidatus Desantisbacteria bacterium]|nr:radical SAM protein [Candidatus Desantisbacteria bacterium]
AYDSWIKPLGLLYIGGILENSGYNIYLLDCLDRNDESLPPASQKSNSSGCGQYDREEIPKPEILKFIPRKYKRYGIKEDRFIEHISNIPKPDVILITSYMTYWYPGVFHAISILKKQFPLTPVILGGIYASLCFTHACLYSGADYVLPGAFNQDTLNLINELTGNNHLLPFLNIFSYKPVYHLYNKLNSISILTSLGCPYKCTYCASKFLQSEYYARNINEVIAEIEFYYFKHGISHIAFYDDALLFNYPDHIEILMDQLISKNLNINFYTPNGLHARFINTNIALKMKKSGFKNLRISLETADPLIQINTGGKISNIEFQSAMNSLLKAGFQNAEIGIYIMAGLPGQNYENIIKTMEFVNQKKVKIKMINFSPIPNSIEWTHLDPDLQKKLNNEPLLQNDIAYLFLSQDINWEKNENLKIMARKLNEDTHKL